MGDRHRDENSSFRYWVLSDVSHGSVLERARYAARVSVRGWGWGPASWAWAWAGRARLIEIHHPSRQKSNG